MRNILIFISLIVASCAVDKLEISNLAQEKSLIYGGEITSKDEFTGAVKIKLSDNGKSFCTGSLVKPNLVITAAHCLAGRMDEWLEDNGAVLVGNAVDGEYIASYRVKSAIFNPEFNRVLAQDSGDYAYLLLEENVPAKIAKVIPAITKAELEANIKVGTEVEIVGFGKREDDSSGIKYKAKTVVTDIIETELLIGGDGIDTCTGDSGGPVYVKLKSGEYRVLGVTSRSSSYTKSCGAGGFYVKANVVMDWVEEDLSDAAIDTSDYTFLDFCKKSKFASIDAATVQVLKNAVRKEDCDEAYELLKKKRILTLGNKRIISLKPFRGLNSLVSLNLYNNQITDIDGLEGLVGLKKLNLGKNSIWDLYPLEQMTSLLTLNLRENRISDVYSIGFLTLLRELDLSENKIESFEGVTSKRLKKLDVSHNLIRDIGTFAGLTRLEELRLFDNGLYTLYGVGLLRSLKELYVSDNLIEDISEIDSLKDTLDTVMLDNNRVTEVAAFKDFSKIKSLGLKDNGIRDLSPLSNLDRLDFLMLYGNPVDRNDENSCPKNSKNELLNKYCSR
jgi:internalin A